MSIYATGWSIRLEMHPPCSLSFGRGEAYNPFYAEIYVQFVPGHIGHPSEYDEDPYSEFLPPVVKDPDETRAAVILLKGFDKKEVQRYLTPLLVLSGQEYAEAKFAELLADIYGRARELLNDILKDHPWKINVSA